jgi:predicted acylesterase/phospholipase RssA
LSKKDIPDTQRALVLQGGGALGAYEAGVFYELYKTIFDREGSNAEKHLFDIVAGSSVGAINSAFLVSYFLTNNNNWKGSAEALEKFWEKLKSFTYVDFYQTLFPFPWTSFWNFWHNINPQVFASPEAARRYWSWVQLANIPGGYTNNMSWTIPKFDLKYLDPNPFESFWLGYNFTPLKTFLEGNIRFPIKTSFEKDEPRFLMVSVDVQDCTTSTTFDSYPKAKDQNGKPIWYSEYGGNSRKNQPKHLIEYDGIRVQEVLASSLFPFSLEHSLLYDKISHSDRMFWDGNFISSTPLREVLQHHREFWLGYFSQNNIDYDDGKLENKDKPKVPNLEVYIINLYPSLEDNFPNDLDSIRDRDIDIKFHDRTKHDEQIAHVVTDYLDLIRTMMDIAVSKAKDKKSLQNEFNNLLESEGPISKKRDGKTNRRYQDLVKGRFKVTVRRIDRQNDNSTIFGKHADFSSITIDELIKKGKHDAHLQLQH